MISHMLLRSHPLLRKTNLAVWRAWRSWKLSLHTSTVSASPGPGSWESEELSSVSAERPPHTPVMLKEVLHYLDVQPGQVSLHLCCFFPCSLMAFRKLTPVCLNVVFKYVSHSVNRKVLKQNELCNFTSSYYHYQHYIVFNRWHISSSHSSYNISRQHIWYVTKMNLQDCPCWYLQVIRLYLYFQALLSSLPWLLW